MRSWSGSRVDVGVMFWSRGSDERGLIRSFWVGIGMVGCYLFVL